MKTCKRCGKEKSLEEFHFNGYTSLAGVRGHMTICKLCSTDKAREYYAANQERQREINKAKAQALRDADPEGMRRKQWESRLLKKYNLTVEDYDRILEEQDGKCAICRADSPGWPSIKAGVFFVDHDHRTGKVRGLLCSVCNQGLGYFKDDPQLLWSAIAYLTGVERVGLFDEVIGKEVMPYGD